MVVALQICSCMLSDPVHLDPSQIPKSHPLSPPPFRSWLNHGLLLMYWLLLVSLCRIQHPFQNALSTYVSYCSAQLCVYTICIVWTLFSAPPISPSHICIVSLCDLDLTPFPHCTLFVTRRQERARCFSLPVSHTPQNCAKMLILDWFFQPAIAQSI